MLVFFDILWRFFAWFNQTLALITLWAVSVWLARKKKFYWIALLPAMFMTVVCSSYILVAPEGFQLPVNMGVGIGVAFMSVLTLLFAVWRVRYAKKQAES